jgi:hypothetical protein
MSEPTASKLKRMHRNVDLGLCRNATAHGPAVRMGLCGPCALAHGAMAKQVRAARKASGVCANAPSHGPATVGAVCDPCATKRRAGIAAYRRKRKLPCAFGPPHGVAVDGTYCAKCVARRTAAAARVALRCATTPQPKPQPLPPRPRKELLLDHITRGGNVDTSNLWETLWRRM